MSTSEWKRYAGALVAVRDSGRIAPWEELGRPGLRVRAVDGGDECVITVRQKPMSARAFWALYPPNVEDVYLCGGITNSIDAAVDAADSALSALSADTVVETDDDTHSALFWAEMLGEGMQMAHMYEPDPPDELARLRAENERLRRAVVRAAVAVRRPPWET